MKPGVVPATEVQTPNPPVAKKPWYDPTGWFDREEYAKFSGEPVREDLTDPPAGYRVPSPDQPYGVGAPKSSGKSQASPQDFNLGSATPPPSGGQGREIAASGFEERAAALDRHLAFVGASLAEFTRAVRAGTVAARVWGTAWRFHWCRKFRCSRSRWSPLLAAAARAGADPQVSHFTLGNGLEVVVVPDHRAPVVTHMIWYKVGAADETPGKSGLAHFLEHLMFKGTTKNPGNRFSQQVAAIGGQENAFTSERLYRVLPARSARAPQRDDGARSRPHHRPRAHRRGRTSRAQRRARRAEHAGRQQSEQPVGRADGRGALSQSSLWPAGDRLAA